MQIQKLLHLCIPLAFSILSNAQTVSEEYRPLPLGAQGVISIPGVLDLFEGVNSNKKQIPIRKQPNLNSPLVMTLQSGSDCSYRTISELDNRAVVYFQIPGWYQIKTRLGMGWISSKFAGKFTSLDNLLHGGYLTDEWDGILRSSPSINSKPLEIKWITPNYPGINEPPGIKVISFEWSEGQLWVHIILTKIIPCSSDVKCLNEDLPGWVPAYSPKGMLIIWFFPLGC